MDSHNFPTLQIKQAIVNSFFDKPPEKLESQYDGLEPFFYYYTTEIKNSSLCSITDSHLKIISIVELLKIPGATRISIHDALKARLLANERQDADDLVESAINLGVKLLLMVSVGSILKARPLITESGERELCWRDGPINELIDTEMGIQKTSNESIKLEKWFNARNLEQIAGVKIRWTSNLADHLRLGNNDTYVNIFHHASFLRLRQNCTILPAAFINETLRTLALLLPEHDKELEVWFAHQQVQEQKHRRPPLDTTARKCKQLKAEERKVDKFEYWHDRLIILKQVFDEAEPSTIKQWWCDRRKRVQWYTFWIAAIVLGLTIIFGLVQSVEGGLQVYYSARQANSNSVSK